MTALIGRGVRTVLVIFFALLWLVPTYLLLVNAMTPNAAYSGSPQWVPSGFGLFQNIAAGFTNGPFAQAALSSFLYAVIGAAIAVIIATAAAYGLVVLPVRHKQLWFWLIYTGTLVPLQVFALPLFFAESTLNLYDTQPGLLIVYVALCIPFAFFITRNFITTLPPEYGEAARLDGASWFSMFWRIHIPLSRSAMAAAFVFQFVFLWNELFFGITLSLSPDVQPIMAALAGLQGNYSNVGEPVILAMALLVSIPPVAVFFGFQRFFTTGLGANL